MAFAPERLHLRDVGGEAVSMRAPLRACFSVWWPLVPLESCEGSENARLMWKRAKSCSCNHAFWGEVGGPVRVSRCQHKWASPPPFAFYWHPRCFPRWPFCGSTLFMASTLAGLTREGSRAPKVAWLMGRGLQWLLWGHEMTCDRINTRTKTKGLPLR